MASDGTTFSAEEYFSTQDSPSNLQDSIDGVRSFVTAQQKAGHKVVLVTSGGTTVPLELNVVRFLDNFSAGTRGATSAEYFLRAGYAVIFMHRQFSLQPFSRHYSHTTNPFLDLLDVQSNGSVPSAGISIKPEGKEFLLQVLKARQEAQKNNLLHTLTFVTINDYLFLLRALSAEMSCLRRNAMYYLAAAVSDFFLPRQKMSEHKIQSRKGSLHIEMDQVPKVLKPMVENWSPEGFIVSFKLETDEKLLIPKARAALERYGHQVVIGNTLHRRKFEVVFVSPSPSQSATYADPKADQTGTNTTGGGDETAYREDWVRLPNEGQGENVAEIEETIVARLLEMHNRWVEEEGVMSPGQARTVAAGIAGIPMVTG